MTHDTTPSVGMLVGTDRAHVSRLLALGLRGPRRPVDRLIARLELPGASEWVDGALRSLKCRSDSDPVGVRELLLDGGEIAAMRVLKDRCKKDASNGTEGEEALEPMLGYFLAIASGLAHHGELISTIPRGEIDAVLLDLASVMPEPWADLLCRATLRG